MDTALIKSLLVIVLRHIAPLIGGAGLMSEGEFEQIASGILLLTSVSYHVKCRHDGKKAKGE